MTDLYNHHHGMHGTLHPEEECIYKASVPEVVEWLREQGAIEQKDWCVRHGSWMSLREGTCFGNPQRRPCDPRPRLVFVDAALTLPEKTA